MNPPTPCSAPSRAGANLLMHAAGWVEGGLCTSYEKFVLDCEIVQSIAHIMQPVPINADTLALDEIGRGRPRRSFLRRRAAPLETVETAFYRPLVSTTQNYGAWVEAGAKIAAERATGIWQEALATYAEPPLDPAIREELAAFVAKRKEQGGAPID